MRPIRQRWQAATTLLPLLLLGCAAQMIPTKAYIEAGQARLLPETVRIKSGTPALITAQVAINGEFKDIGVRSADCNDGIGEIATSDDTIFVFASGDNPSDKLFVQICKIAHRNGSPLP